MKKAIITLAVLVMAFGNMGLAQRNFNLKSDATQNVLKHYGIRSESTIVPEVAEYESLTGERYRTTYTYDEIDYYLIEELMEIDEGDGWRDYMDVTYDYDFYGNVIQALAMSAFTGAWQNYFKADYTYEGGELTEVVYQMWQNSSWMNVSKEVYNYNGDVTTVLYWIWNGSNWSSDELYTYTRNDNTIELIMQYMEGGAWQNEGKQITTLNFDERITEILDQYWEGSSWVNSELTTYNYVGNVFPEKTIKEWYGEWEDFLKFTYEYDGNGNAKHGECFEMGDGWEPSDGDIEMTFSYGEKSVDYYGYHVDMTFVDLTGVKENNATASFNLYPVPAQDEITIEANGFAKAEIYNVMGQKLIESLSDRMNVSTLASGLYIMKVYDQNGQSQMQRFVVK